MSLSKWKKATLFPSRFPLSLPAKAPVCAGNWRLVCLHGETHKRSLITKPNWVLMSSLCSLRSKKCSVPSLCNWRLVEGGLWGGGDRGLEKDEFVPYASFPHISLLLFCWATLHNYLWTCFIRKGPVPLLFHLRCENPARDHRLFRCIFVTDSTTHPFIHRRPRYRVNSWLMDSCQTGSPPPKSDNIRISVIISNRRLYWFKS